MYDKQGDVSPEACKPQNAGCKCMIRADWPHATPLRRLPRARQIGSARGLHAHPICHYACTKTVLSRAHFFFSEVRWISLQIFRHAACQPDTARFISQRVRARLEARASTPLLTGACMLLVVRRWCTCTTARSHSSARTATPPSQWPPLGQQVTASLPASERAWCDVARSTDSRIFSNEIRDSRI